MLHLILSLVIIGLLMWVVTTLLPLPPIIVTLIGVVAVVWVVLVLFRMVGGAGPNPPVV